MPAHVSPYSEARLSLSKYYANVTHFASAFYPLSMSSTAGAQLLRAQDVSVLFFTTLDSVNLVSLQLVPVLKLVG
jgi:hypothetical protein